MESQWTPEISESDFKDQNSIACGILYVIGKLLEHKCLKWAHIVHLESETQVMAKRKARNQTTNLTPDQKKSGIDPIYLVVEGMRDTVGKLSMRVTTFL
jgi:hypothetical protein